VVVTDGVPFAQQSFMDVKTQYQDPNIAQMYAMPNQVTNRFAFQTAPNMVMPMQYTMDWGFPTEGNWGDLEYDFVS
jgi:hypothetical protein